MDVCSKMGKETPAWSWIQSMPIRMKEPSFESDRMCLSEGLTSTLLVVQVAVAKAKVSRRSEDDSAARLRAVAHFRETDIHHSLLNAMQLSLGHVAARKRVGHARQPHHPIRRLCLELAQRCLAHTCGESVALLLEFLCLDLLAAVRSWIKT